MKVIDHASHWLSENGYTLMHSNATGSWGNFVSLDGRTSVEVILKNNEVRCIGCGFIPESMIQIKTPDFGVGNKALFFNLEKIIAAILLYEKHIK